MKNFAQVKLNLPRTNDGFYAQCVTVHTSMAGNPNFLTPIVPMIDLDVKIRLFGIAIAAAATRDRNAIANRNDIYAELRMMMVMLASYVNTTAQGDATIIISSGFGVRAEKSAPQLPVRVTAVSNTFSPNAGTTSLKWKAVLNADSYDVQMSTDQENWRTVSICTRSRDVLTNLPSGVVYFRIAAIGAAGRGDWSHLLNAIVA